MSSPITADSLTRSVEDYLKAIYRLTPQGRPASTSEIAHLLELSAPSVSGMVKRLSELGLLEHLPYKGVQLTAEGRRAALRMVRRHRLIESYLVEFLAYSWDTVHQEAERLEHAVSDTLVERMAAALGHPSVDPHGDPIPTADGAIEELPATPLAVLETGETAEIVRVVENDAERLRYLATLGLKPGATITVLDRQPFGGPVTIETRGEIQVIGQALALVLLCAVGAHR
ncbi:MAG TPA: metal-dependent transcriptional regulator [Gemmatimonadales bacterium]|jgi:DtxR family Mn-dependent transcriptional regulator